MLLAQHVRLSVLLEAILDAHLEVVAKGAGRDGLLLPCDVLVAPVATEMGADIWLELVPIETVKTIESNKIDLIHELSIVVVTH